MTPIKRIEETVDSDGFKLSLLTVAQSGMEPRAVVQLIHGSLEYKERYMPFLEFLASKGFTAVISDLRGHGKSTNAEYPQGYMRDVKEMILDQGRITRLIEERYPGVPIFIFGHSLGSIFARLYLSRYDDKVAGCILTGTADRRRFASLGPLIVDLVAPFTGGMKGRCRFLNKLAGLDKPAETWLSYSKQNLLDHAKDRGMCEMFLNGGFKVLFKADSLLSRKRIFQCLNPELPILSCSGKDDPVTGGPEGLRKTVKTLRGIGYKNVYVKVYEGMMHEVLNEDNKQVVFNDIAAFIDGVLKAKKEN